MFDREKPQQTSSDEATLQKRVDAMMALEGRRPAPAGKKPASDKQPPIDIFHDPKTAPEVSSDLLGKIGIEDSNPTSPDNSAKDKPKEQPMVEVAQLKTEEDQPTPPPDNLDLSEPNLEDAATDKAVDDIVAHEGDTMLAIEDALVRQKTAEAEAVGQQGIIARFFTSFWTWLIIIGIATTAYLWFR